MIDFEAALANQQVVPVISLDDPELALPMAEALLAGGISILEVTLRSKNSMQVLKNLAEDNRFTIGAGSVNSTNQLDQAVSAGAKFIVSPGSYEPLIKAALATGLPYLPGVSTPSEILLNHNLGMELVKFFPAKLLGGPAAIKTVAAPFPTMRFMPTGNITQEDYSEYLALPNVVAVGSSWMVKPELIAAKDWASITKLASLRDSK
ncbi:MAG: bifunctional 4-hydroxy-2-oxoglutarate aldolase/2-dehydro-3-deoxy-phosphogluconate aldolase [Actinobacteria bacterium]|uniref:2-dehydro-3-deoxy-phosphogluconate aldolase n=1 Tax=freshwater metagenome TaxID=449393 RepID=A0A6J6ELF4_9ZZZZ|nr:bifunctional 4-hydroxy-2-oxoglutarate aldolase/2-dehydro-3-deoxy-phosphogluconate aldolase [Actinomycetota bacterium]